MPFHVCNGKNWLFFAFFELKLSCWLVCVIFSDSDYCDFYLLTFCFLSLSLMFACWCFSSPLSASWVYLWIEWLSLFYWFVFYDILCKRGFGWTISIGPGAFHCFIISFFFSWCFLHVTFQHVWFSASVLFSPSFNLLFVASWRYDCDFLQRLLLDENRDASFDTGYSSCYLNEFRAKWCKQGGKWENGSHFHLGLSALRQNPIER